MKKHNKKTSLFRDKKTVIMICFALIYLFIVLNITLIDRNVGHRRKMLEPFWELSQLLKTKQYKYWFIQIFGNIFMLMPFGFMLPAISEKFQSFRLTTGVCLGFSLLIEITQYMTCRGLLEFDDVMHNTFGGVLGFIIYMKINEKISEYRGEEILMKKKLSIAYFIFCIVIDVLAFLFSVLLLIADTQSGDDSARSFFIGLVSVPVIWFIISVIFLKLCLKEKKKTIAVSINAKLSALLTVMGVSYFFIENGIYAAILFIFMGLIGAGACFVMTSLPQENPQTNVIPREFLGYNAGGVWYNAAVEYLRSNNRDLSELEPKNPKQKYMIVQDFEETEYEGLTQADKDKISQYACSPIIYLVQWLVENRHISVNFSQRYNPENVQNLLNGYIPVTKFFKEDMKCIIDNNDISKEIRPFLIYYYGKFIGADLFMRDDDNYFFDYCDVIQSQGARFFCCDYHYDIYREFKIIFDKRYSKFKEAWGSSSPQYNSISAEFRWQRFNADLEVYTYDENSQEQIKRCCEMLNNLSEKEYSKLKRIISKDYENDELKIDYEKMFHPKTVHVFKPNDNDIYCFVSGEAEFEREHGIGFSILNGIVLSVKYAADLCIPYSHKERNLYALGNNDIDFLSLTEQGAVDEYISAGKLIAFKMELDEMVAMDEGNKDKCIYITPAAEKILLEDIHRLKMLCKVGLITNISISCKKEDEVLVPSDIFARGFITREENGENKSKCKYADYIKVWR